ncbi:hypothetical protein O8C97_08780 [Aliarcobacter butzleri]|uniref:hypothetical protein n=1 Tax=Aliarcobacter butzleri TaxID=28197 RepID=UPI00263F06F8|nr:hypothetical protein [Aliarcobacter butzleri]MDN5047931.1 hypothetical protein [Aliarcobacter butzleri]
MRKKIMINNYYPNELKNMRIKLNLDTSNASDLIGIPESDLINYEDNEQKIPIDIFLLGSILKIYEDKYLEDTGNKLNVSITEHLLYPHDDGIAYQEFIIAQSQYKDLPYERNANGNISWLATITSKQGKKRVDFWEKKRIEHNIKATSVLDSGIRQKVAVAVHPTKFHTCLYSGDVTSIEYRYLAPAKITLLNTKYDQEFYFYDLDICEIADILFIDDKCKKLLEVLNVENEKILILDSIEKIKEFLEEEYIKKEKKPYVSPGVMSNSPDRLDGFHSYNSIIRDVIDTGRRTSNLKRYTQDRRAYENWADGNWNKANRLMGEYNKCEEKFNCPKCNQVRKMSPDHIGPISLGFAHRTKFQPLCSKCNSSKNNKMNLEDVLTLIQDEKKENIVSWHSQYIWDKLKNKISTDNDAYELSVLMRNNLHNVLELLSIINKAGFSSFLEGYLNPDYAYNNYTFENFNPLKLDDVIFKEERSCSENDKKKAYRYLRVSFESLELYSDVSNRKITSIIDSDIIEKKISDIIELIDNDDLENAKTTLISAIEIIGNILIKKSKFNT